MAHVPFRWGRMHCRRLHARRRSPYVDRKRLEDFVDRPEERAGRFVRR